MSNNKVFDDFGNEVFWVNINTICPIKYEAEAKQIAYDYFTIIEKVPVTYESMLSKKLRPIGSDKETHIWCPRGGYTHHLQRQINFMVSQNKKWIADKFYTLSEDNEFILSKFIVLTDSVEDILKKLSIEEI